MTTEFINKGSSSWSQNRATSGSSNGEVLTLANRSYVKKVPVSRGEMIVGLVVVGFVNGISEKIAAALHEGGTVVALLNTFNISAIVWVALVLSIRFVLRSPAQPLRRYDWWVATLAAIAFLMPSIQLSWLALSGLAIYVIMTSPDAKFLNRGAWILLALTVPMFWSKLLFALMSDTLLQGDAALVGWFLGTPRVGNAIEFADGSGYLWIAPGCSSLANVSLAILCWITVTKTIGYPASRRDLFWVFAACLSVIGINVTRISLIGFYPQYFDILHGPIGATVASWLILGATLGICLLGTRYGHRDAARI
ncbi:hypothetical protein [Microvirga rosea]|uniref:hypothetical protein n=1 Tax=Microvirga rosea TaxID=2715425 RepID=UPI001D0AB71B|nr:hypothetical protein [Microvirga rosea]MCB8818943.1 hypothetical protein [Microvirga rosea]